MTIATVRNGLVTTLQAGGKFAASQISTCDFGIINGTTCAVILQPGPGTRVEPVAQGTFDPDSGARRKLVTWDLAGIGLVKDDGNPLNLLSRMWTIIDDVVAAVDADDTLDNSSVGAIVTDIGRPSIDAFVEGEGMTYAFITFRVQAHQFRP